MGIDGPIKSKGSIAPDEQAPRIRMQVKSSDGGVVGSLCNVSTNLQRVPARPHDSQSDRTEKVLAYIHLVRGQSYVAVNYVANNGGLGRRKYEYLSGPKHDLGGV